MVNGVPNNGVAANPRGRVTHWAMLQAGQHMEEKSLAWSNQPAERAVWWGVGFKE